MISKNNHYSDGHWFLYCNIRNENTYNQVWSRLLVEKTQNLQCLLLILWSGATQMHGPIAYLHYTNSKKARQNITYRIYNYLLTPGAASALLVSIDLTSAEATVDLTKAACS